jgi:hypothetical protein
MRLLLKKFILLSVAGRVRSQKLPTLLMREKIQA